MSQLKKFRQHFAQHFFLYLAGFIVVALLLAVILNVLTPQPQKITYSEFVVKNFDNSNSTFKRVSFSGEKITLPEKLTIFQANKEQTANAIAEKIIANFQLGQLENYEGYWRNENKVLIRRELENEFALYDYDAENATDPASLEKGMDVNQAISICDSFFKNASQVDLRAQLNDVQHLSVHLESTLVAISEAQSLIIPYGQVIDGYRVYYENENDYPFYCAVSNQYEIRQVVFKDFFLAFEPAGELNSLDIEGAIKNITEGKASIVNAESQITEETDLNWIKEANLKSVELVYRYDSQLNLAYPFYQFTGILTNSSGVDLESTVITPAILGQLAE